MQGKAKKISFLILSFLVCFSFSVPVIQAVGVDSISDGAVTGAMNAAMSDLGVNKTELKYIIQTMNVQRRKKQQPQVSLNFNPATPAPGQKVTAVATPIYFLNTDKDLYFTWYLKQDGCPETTSVSGGKKRKCDMDDDGDIDINDYKVKAARIIANNDWEWSKDGAYSSHTDGDGYDAVWGGNDQQGKNNFCYVHDIESGDEYKIECNRHLFADQGDTDSKTGDGSFDASEERFWHTNPNDPDTADTGNGDEANIAGLGINSFSWVYEEGDEIGVVVEGVSIEATQEADSSYKIMFALLNNSCNMDYENKYPITETVSDTTVTNYDVDGVTPLSTTRTIVSTTEVLNERAAFYAKTTTTTTTRTIVNDLLGNLISDNSTSTTAAPVYKNIDSSYYPKNIKKVSDINKCLTDNMIDPMEGGGTKEKMNIELSYSPQSPINDTSPGGEDGNLVTVNSSVLNAQNDKYLSYYWQVFKNEEANPEDWGEPLTKSQLKDSTQTQGVGANRLNFRLRFSDPGAFYLKVKLTVKENVSGSKVREGYNYIVIPVSSSADKLLAFNTTVTADASGKPLVHMGENELCKTGIDKAICPAVKHQIIGVQAAKNLSDYSWTINGEPFNFTECFFEGCNPEKQTDVMYFPTLGNVGTQYEISLTANNLDTGKKVNLTRYFEVVEPSVKISSADKDVAKPVLLGHYIDYDGIEWPDWSEKNFVSTAGKDMTFSANFSGFIPESANWGWVVDGVGVNIDNASNFGYEINESNNLIVPAASLGQTTSVGLTASYFPNILTRKALNSYWDVNYGDFYEAQVGDSINVYSVESISNTQASAKSNKLLASLFSSTPSYIAFLLRIVLTGALLIFFSGFILSFFPNIKENEI